MKKQTLNRIYKNFRMKLCVEMLENVICVNTPFIFMLYSKIVSPSIGKMQEAYTNLGKEKDYVF